MDEPLKYTTGPAAFEKRRVLSHILFWIAFYIYDGPVSANIEDDPMAKIHIAAIDMPAKILATYFTLYLISAFYNNNRKPARFYLYLALSVVFFGLAQRFISYAFVYPVYYPAGLQHSFFYLPKVTIETFGVYSIVAIAVMIHLVRQWYKSQQERQQLQNEKLEAELKYLKAQIHPHFLFNTLNNLYSLTVTSSKKAPDIVYKLSQLMSYMLYDSNKQMVPLQKEIEYIENYITLEKIRYEDRLDVSLNILTPTEGIEIAPLLILPFVENSFKHGFSNDIGKVWVYIDILVNINQLVIKVENSKGKADITDAQRAKSGIGLQNVRKRLELIYKDRFDLQIFDSETYLVVLKLTI